MIARRALVGPVALVLATAACSGGPTLPTAIAARRSQLVASIPNVEISDLPQDPESLFLLLGSAGRDCNEPFLTDLVHDIECEDYWRVSLALPPALGQPGTIDLASPDLVNGFLRVIPKGSGCLVEGDQFTVGSLQIVSITETQVSFRIDGAKNPDIVIGDGVPPLDADGAYSAVVCP